MKRLGLLVAATFTLAILAPVAASAGVGTIEMNGSAPCNITYTYGGSVPGSGALSGFESDECAFNMTTLNLPTKIENLSSVGATLTGTPGSGSVTIDGPDLRVTMGGLVTCRYELTTLPTGSYLPDYFYTTVSGTAEKFAGSFLCPASITQIYVEGSLP